MGVREARVARASEGWVKTGAKGQLITAMLETGSCAEMGSTNSQKFGTEAPLKIEA